MVATPSQDIEQAQVEAVVAGAVTDIFQGQVLAVFNYRAVDILVEQAQVLAPITASIDLEISQAQVLAVVRGRVDNRKVRAWAFSLDGHDFYVLRLGMITTLVYDMTTNQWSEWTSGDLPFFRLVTGLNWLGTTTATINHGATSPVMAGDDTYGLIWTIVPEVGVDQDPRGPDYDDVTFERKVTGGVPNRLRDAIPCSGVYLTASIGSPVVGAADIVLQTSDDNGKTWQNQGTVTANVDEWNQEFSWRSLGQITAPGRIFQITDSGASVRLDSLDMY